MTGARLKPPRKKPKELARLASEKIVNFAKSEHSRQQLLAAAMATATAAAGVTAAAAIHENNNLSKRVGAVESRPVVDSKSLAASSAALGGQVAALRRQSAALSRRLSGLHPVAPAAVQGLADGLATAAGELAQLSGQVSQAATLSTTAQQAKDLSTLAGTLARTATSLGTAMAATDAKASAALAGLDKVASDLTGVSSSVDALAASVDQQNTVIASVAAAASAAAQQNTDALNAALARIPITVEHGDTVSLNDGETGTLAGFNINIIPPDFSTFSIKLDLSTDTGFCAAQVFVDGSPVGPSIPPTDASGNPQRSGILSALGFAPLSVGNHDFRVDVTASGGFCRADEAELTIARL